MIKMEKIISIINREDKSDNKETGTIDSENQGKRKNK